METNRLTDRSIPGLLHILTPWVPRMALSPFLSVAQLWTRMFLMDYVDIGKYNLERNDVLIAKKYKINHDMNGNIIKFLFLRINEYLEFAYSSDRIPSPSIIILIIIIDYKC